MEAIYRTNIIATRHLLAALATLSAPPESILLASSANIYGNANVSTIDENTPPAPANDYAVSKLAMEYMAHLWLEKLPIVIVRPFNYTGVGQRDNFLLPKIVKHFRQRMPILELGNIEVERDFSDVRTVVEAYRRLLESRVARGTFNVCSGTAYSLNQVLDMMSQMTHHSPEIRINPNFVRANEVKRLVGSKTFLESTVGLLSHYPLEQTLKWMLASTRQF
jgi:nucleoside-diphosphate-sugar epimerase